MIELLDTREQVEALPDGTIISWLRIPGDETSRAVAFVRVEHPDCDVLGACTDQRCPGPTVWISPGGWQPLSIEDAQLTYPVQVVTKNLREHVNLSKIPVYAVPDPWPSVTGGTWNRDKALDAAARLYVGHGMTGGVDNEVLETAEYFLKWLNHDPEADEVQHQLDVALGLAPEEPKTTAVYRPEPGEAHLCCCSLGAPLVCGECGRGDHGKCKVMSQMGDDTP